MASVDVRRGDVFYADLNATVGSEQGGRRPVVVIQNDIGNEFSPTTIAFAITSNIDKARLPTHVELSAKKYPIKTDSVILCEQVRTLDKSRLFDYVTTLDYETMRRVEYAAQISLGFARFSAA